MKRISFVLTLLLAIGLVGTFAVDFEPVVDFSASAENTFGIDLNDETSTGFDLSAEADLSVMFVDTTVEKGEGDVYGWIKIEDIELGMMIDEETDPEDAATFEDDGDFDGLLAAEIGDISARVMFDPAYVQISTTPDFDYDNAEALRLQLDDDNDPEDTVGTDDLIEANAGIIIGADGLGEMFDVAFKLGSVDTYEKSAGTAAADGYFEVWSTVTGELIATGSGSVLPGTGDAAVALDGTPYTVLVTDIARWVIEPVEAVAAGGNTENDYVMGLTLTVRPMEGLTVDAAAVFTNVEDAGMGFTLKPVFVMDALEVGVPADAYIDSDSDMVYEAAPYVTYNLTEDGSMVGLWAYYADTTDDSFTGNAVLDVKAGFSEVAEGFVPGLEAGLYAYLFDVLDVADADNDIALGIAFDASYDIDGIKPFVDVNWAQNRGQLLDAAMLQDDDTAFDAVEDVMTMSAGVELALIENTVFTLEYSSDNLLDDTLDYSSTGEAGIDKGRITFTTAISY